MLYSKIFKENGDVICYYLMKAFEDRDGGDNISIRVENEANQDAFAEWVVPAVVCNKAFGFSEDDLLDMEDYIEHNEVIIWDMAREEGMLHT